MTTPPIAPASPDVEPGARPHPRKRLTLRTVLLVVGFASVALLATGWWLWSEIRNAEASVASLEARAVTVGVEIGVAQATVAYQSSAFNTFDEQRINTDRKARGLQDDIDAANERTSILRDIASRLNACGMGRLDLAERYYSGVSSSKNSQRASLDKACAAAIADSTAATAG